MQTTYLKHFVDVAEKGSIGAAAAADFISPQGMSRSISVLESELGCTLFSKKPNGMALTRFGEALLDDAKEILALEQEMKARVARIQSSDLENGTSDLLLLYLNNIAFDAALFSPLTDSIEEAFASARFFQCDNEKIADSLLAADEAQQDALALGLLCLFSTDTKRNSELLERLYARGFAFQPYLESYDEVMVPADSDLASKTSLSKSDILSYPLIVSGGDIQRVCEKVFGKASIYMVTADSLFRYQVVQKGQAITVVPAFHHIVDSGAQGTVVVPMKEPYYLEVGFVAKREVMESPVVKRLFAKLNAYYSKFASSPYISLVPSEITSVSAEEARFASTMDSLCKRFCGKYKLSQREGEILVPLLAGKTARPIAEELSVGTATVKSHIYSIYKKAGVHSQKDLMSLFREMEA